MQQGVSTTPCGQWVLQRPQKGVGGCFWREGLFPFNPGTTEQGDELADTRHMLNSGDSLQDAINNLQRMERSLEHEMHLQLKEAHRYNDMMNVQGSESGRDSLCMQPLRNTYWRYMESANSTQIDVGLVREMIEYLKKKMEEGAVCGKRKRSQCA
eukprot:766114-Hanusia_phi.AAC.6